MKRIVVICAALITVMVSAAAAFSRQQAEPDRDAVTLGADAVERQLARGQAHEYELAMQPGERVAIVVDERGIDVSIRVRDSKGTTIGEVQDEVGGRNQERVEIVADTSGIYTLTVKPAFGGRVAGAYTIRVVDRRPATDADRRLQEARALRVSASRLDTQGQFAQACAQLERAVTLAESVFGADAVQVADVMAQLAGVYRRLPDNPQSEALYLRALAIMDRTRGPSHPTTAMVRSLMAVLYEHMGQRSKSEALLRDAFAVFEKTVGAEHPWYVNALVTLGNVRNEAGDLDEAERVELRGKAILEKNDDTASSQYASFLNNLGEIARQKGDFARAQELLERGLVLTESLQGMNGYSVAITLQNLGIVARERKDYEAADGYYRRALAIRESTAGPDHPDVAQHLTNLANIYRATGDYARSLETNQRALHIWEQAAGPYQPALLLSIGNMARTYAASGDIANAIAQQRRADAILEKQLALNLAIGSERQKLAFMSGAWERTERTISLHLELAPDNADAAALATLVLLQRKGRVLDAMADTYASFRQHVTATRDRDLLDQLKATIGDLAQLALSAPDPSHGEGQRQAIQAIELRKERIEAELSEHSAEIRANVQPVTLEAVQAALPDDAALLEFAVFRPFDPNAERNAEAYAPPHYAAYVVRKNTPPIGRDLGPAKPIDDAIEALRGALRDPERTDLVERARVVDEQVMRPLRASLGRATRLLISPDGALNLVPIEALIDENGRYLIERYSTSYLTSGRDLLRMQVKRAPWTPPVVIADPLFGEPRLADRRPPPSSTSARDAQRNVTIGGSMSAMYFAPLAGTAAEARAIKTLFPEATLVTGPRATKANLQAVTAPRILHIASHGFFLSDSVRATGNPLLRSGLALAGANLASDSHDAGVLTALEASGLNLWGTRLVTLSACDTGVGEIRNGEGVYGLRRAFVLAGTETLVMSLWPVSDYTSRETMTAYYTGLRAGVGRGDALRQAKLTILRRAGRRHPFYWASFIQSGEWAGLDGKR